ncbi:MAG: aminoacyl-tRNA hydrolase [Hyphomicrobiales bacterium]|nr:MAG: aminoacyl-tRNA hydrolase [Hyphomicrobiales bacterium]
MLLVVGLGNPGAKYAHNRHNIGFMAVDAIHRRHGFGPWRRKFQADIADGTLGGEKALLIKPQTFMNESGRSVGEAVRFYKLEPGDVVVLHDELDLPAAKIRMKSGGGHGGHNGLRSISAHIGDGYRRMRLGIGHPGNKAMVHHYVLSDFAKVDADWLEPLLDAVGQYADLLGDGKDSTFANKVHLAVTPEKATTPKKKKPAAEPAAEKQGDAAPEAESGSEAPVKAAHGGPLAEALARLFPKRKT